MALTDEQITTLLLDIDIEVDDLDPNLPPGYSPNNGWFSKPGCVMDLALRTLMIKKFKDKTRAE